jgi:flagellar FliL protein
MSGKSSSGEGHEEIIETRKGGRGKKLALIGIVLIILLGGIGAALYFTGVLAPSESNASEEGGHEAADDHAKPEEHSDAPADDHGGEKKDNHAKKDGDHGKGGAEAGPVFMDLPPFLVNLDGGKERSSFMKMVISLEVASKEDEEKVKQMQPRIMDQFNTYLRELRADDLKGAAGMHRLREELLLRVNQSTYPAKINDILFKEILVQ